MTLLAEVVAASEAVAATSARSAKVAALATLLRRLDRTRCRSSSASSRVLPRQGRVGVGYATVHGAEAAPAAEPTLSVSDLDDAIAHIEGTTGAGSAGEAARRARRSARTRHGSRGRLRPSPAHGRAAPGRLAA